MQPNVKADDIRDFTPQQKQRKQLTLSNSKNIFTYHFHPALPLQPNFVTDVTKNFIAQQKQRKQLILTDIKNILTYCFQAIELMVTT